MWVNWETEGKQARRELILLPHLVSSSCVQYERTSWLDWYVSYQYGDETLWLKKLISKLRLQVVTLRRSMHTFTIEFWGYNWEDRFYAQIGRNVGYYWSWKDLLMFLTEWEILRCDIPGWRFWNLTSTTWSSIMYAFRQTSQCGLFKQTPSIPWGSLKVSGDIQNNIARNLSVSILSWVCHIRISVICSAKQNWCTSCTRRGLSPVVINKTYHRQLYIMRIRVWRIGIDLFPLDMAF